MSQNIVCLKKYAKDSRIVYYEVYSEFEVQIDALMAYIAHNTLCGGRGFD